MVLGSGASARRSSFADHIPADFVFDFESFYDVICRVAFVKVGKRDSMTCGAKIIANALLDVPQAQYRMKNNHIRHLRTTTAVATPMRALVNADSRQVARLRIVNRAQGLFTPMSGGTRQLPEHKVRLGSRDDPKEEATSVSFPHLAGS